jgi:integrase
MGRPAKVRWCQVRRAWISSVGDISTLNGRRKPVPFREDRSGRPIGPKDKARAQQALNDYLAERETQVIVRGEFTFGQLVTVYLAHSKEHAAPLTYKGHRKVLRLVCRFEIGGRTFGDKLSRDFTVTDLDYIVRAWANEDKKPSYIARMVSSIQAVFNWAADPLANREPTRLIPLNPVRGFHSEHCKIPEAEDRYATDEEVEAFIKWGRKRARSIGGLTGRFERMTIELIRAIALTGARPSELCKALWNDFEPRKVKAKTGDWWGQIMLPPKRHKTGGKTGKPREIFCPPELVRTIEAIGRLKDHHPDCIWTHRRGARSATRGANVAQHGEPWNSNALSRRINELRKMAIEDGVPVSDVGVDRFVAYRLRHTAAAKLLMSGEDIYTVAKLLGTSAVMIQRRYGSILRTRLVDAASGLMTKSGADKKGKK